MGAVTKLSAPKSPVHGVETLEFLRTFEGAVAPFLCDEEAWSLWMPELSEEDRPLTPASQVFFPVILRHSSGAAHAIRFYYDCESGKIRFYTSAIPEEVAVRAEFENAISELFRHSVPVEPVRPRAINRSRRPPPVPARPPRARTEEAAPSVEAVEPAAIPEPAPVPLSLPPPVAVVTVPPPVGSPPAAESAPAEPAPVPPAASLPPAVLEPAGPVVPAVSTPVTPLSSPLPSPSPSSAPASPAPAVSFEIGPRTRSVLLALVFTVALLILAGMGLYAFLRVSEDPGVAHHRLQLEAMKLREGR